MRSVCKRKSRGRFGFFDIFFGILLLVPCLYCINVFFADDLGKHRPVSFVGALERRERALVRSARGVVFAINYRHHVFPYMWQYYDITLKLYKKWLCRFVYTYIYIYGTKKCITSFSWQFCFIVLERFHEALFLYYIIFAFLSLISNDLCCWCDLSDLVARTAWLFLFFSSQTLKPSSNNTSLTIRWNKKKITRGKSIWTAYRYLKI